jgi:hypothetical protein
LFATANRHSDRNGNTSSHGNYFGTASVCPNGAATITFTGTPNATVTYTVNGGLNQTIVLSAGGTATITGNYTATTVFTLVSIATSGTQAVANRKQEVQQLL